MSNLFAMLDLLLAQVQERFPDEVDLVAYYGSHAQGTATAGSDLDLFYVPAAGKNPPIGRTVLIGGLLVDFWPISWERLEDFAMGRTRGWSLSPSLVYHAKVVYRRTTEAKSRLQGLKQQITDLQKPQARPQMVKRAMDRFAAVLTHLGNLRLAGAGGAIADVRHAAFHVLLAAWECLALANQALLDQGYRSIIGQADRLHAKPADFQALVGTIGTSSDPQEVMTAAERIAMGTREVLRQCQQSLPVQRSVAQQFEGAYPEIRDGFRKVLAACEQQRPFDASIAAWTQQVDLSSMLAALQSQIGSHTSFNLYSDFSAAYAELGLPNLMGCPPDDLVTLARETERLDQAVQQWLREHSVSLHIYEDLEAFARSL